MLADLTVFDFETTGLDARTNRVIEIAAMRVVEGKVVTEFSTLVKIDSKLDEKIIEITGITDAELSNAMDEDSAFRILRKIMGDSLIVAHNAAFDLSFLYHATMRIYGKGFTNHFIDTLTISRDRHAYPHKLETMCQRYDIKLEGAHRALNDVRACYELLLKLHSEKDISEYVNRLSYLRKYGPPAWFPEYATLQAVENKYA